MKLKSDTFEAKKQLVHTNDKVIQTVNKLILEDNVSDLVAEKFRALIALRNPITLEETGIRSILNLARQEVLVDKLGLQLEALLVEEHLNTRAIKECQALLARTIQDTASQRTILMLSVSQRYGDAYDQRVSLLQSETTLAMMKPEGAQQQETSKQSASSRAALSLLKDVK